MPRTTKRRTTKRKRTYGSSNQYSLSLVSPLPTKYTTKLVYSEEIAINAGAGTTGQYVFSMNGMWDPDISGVGHQPRGFDQLLAMYDHFVVIGSKITVTVDNSTNPGGQMLMIMPYDTATTISSTNDWLENGRVKKVPVEGGS